MMNTYILQLETATSVCSVAIAKNGQTVVEKHLDEPNVHASHLTVLIDELMQMAGITYRDLSAVAVSKGPGSYTGLRIGVSTAKGMGFALEIPLLSVNTLEMMHLAVAKKEGAFICPMIDARRMEVFTALFDDKGKTIKETEAKIIDAHSFEKELETHQIYFVGNGATKCAGIITHENAIFSTQSVNHASQMSALVYEKYLKQDFENLAYFEPFYLKEYVPTISKKQILG